MSRLSGKIAVVTGANSGIGLATAKRFAQEGAHVFITGRRAAELDAAARAIGKNVTTVQGDVSKLPDLDRLFEMVKREKGHIDILFANAGGGEFLALGAITEEHFDKTFATNVKGVVFTVQKALPLLAEGASVILNASSVSVKGMPQFSVYAATKAAIRSFARSWILDLKGRNIRVNVLSPGVTETPALNGLAKSEDEARALKEGMLAAVPIGRAADADEIAKAALFLASDDSSYVTGAELFVDGGMAQV